MILKLTEGDRLIGTLVETGFYPLIVTKFGELQKSKSGKSFSTFVEFQISDGKFKGKEFTVAFNTETNSASVLGSMVFMPLGFMFNLASAILNIPVAQVPQDIDTDLLTAKPFDGKIEKMISDGIPINALLAFLPLGAGTATQALPF